jgi:glycosyltransferase involved in cell wall biosynthesis
MTAPAIVPKTSSQQKTLVFFGRLERRKGAFLFAEAVEGLLTAEPSLGVGNPLSVVFLGSQTISHSKKMSDLIRDRLSRFNDRLDLSFIENYSTEESLAYLSRDSHLVCMPSLADNSPYVVIEAIEAGLDFIASRSGGQAELINAKDQDLVLCEPEVDAWVEMLRSRMNMAPIPVRPSRAAVDANDCWLRFHSRLEKQIHKSRLSKSRARKKQDVWGEKAPLVSVVMGISPSDEKNFWPSLTSILMQNYPAIEVCVSADCPARVSDSISSKRVTLKKFDRKKGESLLETAAQSARGKYILFLDGGGLLETQSLTKLVRAFEATDSKRLRHIGFSGLVECQKIWRGKKEFREISSPLPSTLVRASVGQCLTGVFTLWNRQRFVTVAKKTPVHLNNDYALRSFMSYAVTANLQIGSIPDILIRDLRSVDSQVWDSDERMSSLDAFSRVPGKALVPLLRSTSAFSHEMNQFRDLYFREHIKANRLEEFQTRPELPQAVATVLPEQKIAVVSVAGENYWRSCEAINAGLRSSYESLIPKASVREWRISAFATGSEVKRISQEIAAFAPDVLAMLDTYAVYGRLLLEIANLCQGENCPTFRFHVYGDFTLRAYQWLGWAPDLMGKNIEWVCASEQQSKLVSSLIMRPKNATWVCPFPVVDENFRFNRQHRARRRRALGFKETDFVAVYTGRMTLQKNVIAAIRAFAALPQETIENSRLVFAGEFDDLGAPFEGIDQIGGGFFYLWQKEMTALKPEVANRIHLLRGFSRKDLPSLYSAADAYISLSLQHDEDFGMAPAEASLQGLPLILTKWGGYNDFLSMGMPASAIEVRLGESGPEFSIEKVSEALLHRSRNVLAPSERVNLGRIATKKLSIRATADRLMARRTKPPEFEGFEVQMGHLAKLFDSKRGTLLFSDCRKGSVYEQVYRNYVECDDVDAAQVGNTVDAGGATGVIDSVGNC